MSAGGPRCGLGSKLQEENAPGRGDLSTECDGLAGMRATPLVPGQGRASCLSMQSSSLSASLAPSTWESSLLSHQLSKIQTQAWRAGNEARCDCCTDGPLVPSGVEMPTEAAGSPCPSWPGTCLPCVCLPVLHAAAQSSQAWGTLSVTCWFPVEGRLGLRH